MADSTLSALPAASALSGSELFYSVQSAADVKVTATQMKTFALAAPLTITGVANTSVLTSTGYSLTGANAQNMVDLAGTWNTSGNPVALKIAITNTASGATSKFVSLLAGASGTAEFFSVTKAGATTLGDPVTGTTNAVLVPRTFNVLEIMTGAGDYQTTVLSGGFRASVATGSNVIVGMAAVSLNSTVTSGLGLASTQPIMWVNSSTDVFAGTADLFLTRKGAANLRLGQADVAAPVAQSLSVQSVVAGTSNTAGANLTITGSQGTGTGVGGDIIFQTAPAGTTGTSQNALLERLRVGNDGKVTATRGSGVAVLNFASNGDIKAVQGRIYIGAFAGIGGYGIGVEPAGIYAWGSSAFDGTSTPQTFISSPGAAKIQLGNIDQAAPVAQSLIVQSVVAGTTNTAGVDTNITGSLSTGSGIAGKIIFNLSQIVAAATTQNASSSVLSLNTIAASGIQFPRYGAGALSTDASGNITATSDERLKHVVGNFKAGLAELMKIDPIIFKWRADSGMETAHEYVGFGAHNVQESMPEAVGQTPDGYLTLSDRALLAACVNAIKDLSERMHK